MMMKKTMMVLAMASMMLLPAAAQQDQQQAKKRLTPAERSERRATAMADRMMLNDDVKAKFVPLYQQYVAEQEAIDSTACPAQAGAGQALSDEQIAQRIEQGFDRRQQHLDLDRKYYKEFSRMLNARQLQQLFGAAAQAGKQPFRYLQRPGQVGAKANWQKGQVRPAAQRQKRQ